MREAIRLQPQLAGAHTTLAAVLRQMGDTSGAEAESQLGDTLVKQKIGVQGATFATNSGKRMLTAGDLDGAISQFRSAIKMSPTYPAGALSAGHRAVAQGRKDRGRRRVQQAQRVGSRS